MIRRRDDIGSPGVVVIKHQSQLSRPVVALHAGIDDLVGRIGPHGLEIGKLRGIHLVEHDGVAPGVAVVSAHADADFRRVGISGILTVRIVVEIAGALGALPHGCHHALGIGVGDFGIVVEEHHLILMGRGVPMRERPVAAHHRTFRVVGIHLAIGILQVPGSVTAVGEVVDVLAGIHFPDLDLLSAGVVDEVFHKLQFRIIAKVAVGEGPASQGVNPAQGVETGVEMAAVHKLEKELAVVVRNSGAVGEVT